MRVLLPGGREVDAVEHRELALHQPGAEGVVAADTAEPDAAVLHLEAAGLREGGVEARRVLVDVGEVEGDVPALEDPAHGGGPFGVVGEAAVRGLGRRRQRAGIEVAAEGRVDAEADLRDVDARDAPARVRVVAELRHGDRQAQVDEVEQARLAVVEGIEHVEHAQRVGASPVHDLPAELEVELGQQGAFDPQLAHVRIPLVAVQHRVGVLAAPVGQVGEVVESGARRARLPFAGKVEIELQAEARAQAHQALVVRARAGAMLRVGEGADDGQVAGEVPPALGARSARASLPGSLGAGLPDGKPSSSKPPMGSSSPASAGAGAAASETPTSSAAHAIRRADPPPTPPPEP